MLLPGGRTMSRVRIIGGEWKRRLVTFHEVPGLRPTPDAVRETLFNWLGQDLGGLACLDLFAGSGALGFEAASRGAAHVTLVEQNARAFRSLQENAGELGSDRLEVVRMDALKFLAHAPRRYDVLFFDPPYHRDWIASVESRLPHIAHENARLYVEAERPIERMGAWQTTRSGKCGQVFYHLLEASSA